MAAAGGRSSSAGARSLQQQHRQQQRKPQQGWRQACRRRQQQQGGGGGRGPKRSCGRGSEGRGQRRVPCRAVRGCGPAVQRRPGPGPALRGALRQPGHGLSEAGVVQRGRGRLRPGPGPGCVLGKGTAAARLRTPRTGGWVGAWVGRVVRVSGTACNGGAPRATHRACWAPAALSADPPPATVCPALCRATRRARRPTSDRCLRWSPTTDRRARSCAACRRCRATAAAAAPPSGREQQRVSEQASALAGSTLRSLHLLSACSARLFPAFFSVHS